MNIAVGTNVGIDVGSNVGIIIAKVCEWTSIHLLFYIFVEKLCNHLTAFIIFVGVIIMFTMLKDTFGKMFGYIFLDIWFQYTFG